MAPQGWKLGTQTLDQLAESFGIVTQIERYRVERRAYWAVLGIIGLVDATNSPVGQYDPGPPPPPGDGPAGAGETLLDMLEHLLGAYLIAEEPRRQAG